MAGDENPQEEVMERRALQRRVVREAKRWFNASGYGEFSAKQALRAAVRELIEHEEAMR